MIVDRLDPDWSRRCDVCVVGAGPVGLALACHLVRRGRRVLLLEAGGNRPVAGLPGVSEIELADVRTHAAGYDVTRQGLGGTASAWGGACQRLGAVAFTARSHVAAPPMPCGNVELEADYRNACTFLGVEPNATGGAICDAERATGSCAGATLQFARERDPAVRHRDEIATSDLLITCLNTRVAGLHLAAGEGRISGIEVFHAGRRMTLAPPAVVLSCGGVQTARLLLLAQREHPQMLGGESGPLGRNYMGHLTGSIARIVFTPPSGAHRFVPQRAADGSTSRPVIVLSAQTQAAHALLSTYFVPRNFPLGDPRYRHGGLSAVHLGLSLRYLTPHYMRVWWPSYVPSEFDFGLELGAHLLNILHTPVETAVGIFAILAQRRARPAPGIHVETSSGVYALGYHAEQAPSRDSRVTLSTTCDGEGIAIPRADLRYGSQDVESVVRSHELLAERLVRTRTGKLVWRTAARDRAAHVAAQASDGFHQLGLTRIAASPLDGVVDHDLAVHGITNLFVAGCGVLPVSSHAHPTLTAVALAIRLARTLA